MAFIQSIYLSKVINMMSMTRATVRYMEEENVTLLDNNTEHLLVQNDHESDYSSYYSVSKRRSIEYEYDEYDDY